MSTRSFSNPRTAQTEMQPRQLRPRPGGGDKPRRSSLDSRQAGVNARNAGLDLIRRVNRWMIAGAVAATGLISLVASQSFHGHTVSSSSGSAASSSQSGSSGGGSTSSGSGTAIQQPAQPPSSASSVGSAGTSVVSGGS